MEQNSISESITPKIKVKEITFSNGTVFKLNSDEVIILVGPNNVGKSLTLNSLYSKLQQSDYTSPIIESISTEKVGDSDDFENYILRNAKKDPDRSDGYIAYKVATDLSSMRSFWTGNQGLRTIVGLFVEYIRTRDRLDSSDSVENIDPNKKTPHHPLHNIYYDPNKEEIISKFFFTAFGVDLIINRFGGRYIDIKVGKRPPHRSTEALELKKHIDEIAELSPLHIQGDGIKAFAGILLHLFGGTQQIYLIDEPEAFLHPPQAKIIGEVLGSTFADDKQIFIATHSGDVLKGLLSTNQRQVQILRITKDQNNVAIKKLSNESIVQLWSDPLLKYSTILDGLFHDSVTICEADGDCKFFSALLDCIKPDHTEDILFTYSGGKERLSVMASALIGIGVRVRIIADFDILREERTLTNVIASLDGDFRRIQSDYKIVQNAFTNTKAELKTDEAKKQITHLLDSEKMPSLTVQTSNAIKNVLKQASPWAIAKAMGEQYIGNGEPTKAYQRLRNYLESIGLFIIPTGELESFDKRYSNHGPKWVNEVLQNPQLCTDPTLNTAREFVKKVYSL